MHISVCNYLNNGAYSLFDMCDNGIDYKVYQYNDHDNNEFVQVYMSPQTRTINKLSVTPYDLYDSVRRKQASHETDENKLPNRRWLSIEEIAPEDSKYHKVLASAHDYFGGKQTVTDKFVANETVAKSERVKKKHLNMICKIAKKKKYKIPGRKGYVTEEEYMAWTDSIPDQGIDHKKVLHPLKPVELFPKMRENEKFTEALKIVVCEEYDMMEIGEKASVRELINRAGGVHEDFAVYMEVYYYLEKYADSKNQKLRKPIYKGIGNQAVPTGIPYNFEFVKSQKNQVG